MLYALRKGPGCDDQSMTPGFNSQPERVLMLSKDSTLLSDRAGFGDTLARHIVYAERLQAERPGSELRILTYSKKGAESQKLSPVKGLEIYGTQSRHRLFFGLDALACLRQVLAGWWPTVVTTQEPWEDGQLGLWLANRYGARFVPQLHFDLLSVDWLREHPLNRLKAFIARRTLKQASAVRVVSTVQKEKLVRSLPVAAERIHVIPVGVSFQPTSKTKEACKSALSKDLLGHPVVLFVGRLCTQKNLPLWVEVAYQVHAQAPDTRFVIAGDGHMRANIQQAVCAKGLDAAFLFLGNVDYQDLPEVYGAADVFLLTSDYEGFGRVIVEAYLAGVPVVATICTGPEDIIVEGETGYLCPVGDGRKLAEATLSLLQNPEKRSAFGRLGQQHVRDWFGRDRLTRLLIQLWTA
ncbi:MAG: glycosyltransferase family 4 protein [Cyanobacteria bacterium J06560_6]